jgi:hypothetical protein
MSIACSIEATRELCSDLDNLIELTKESRAPVRAVSLIERARADLQAYLDEIEQTSSAPSALACCGQRENQHTVNERHSTELVPTLQYAHPFSGFLIKAVSVADLDRTE